MFFSVLITSSINPHYSASICEGQSEIQGKITYIDKCKIAVTYWSSWNTFYSKTIISKNRAGLLIGVLFTKQDRSQPNKPALE